MSEAPNPFLGIPDALKPNPPGEVPEAPGPGDAMASASPFTEPQDIDAIIKQLVFDRPLKLFIPHKEKMPGWEFRIINSIPQEIAVAHNKGFREVTNPEMTKLFTDLVAGTDKSGRAYRPLLMARPKAVGEFIREQSRKKLQGLYAGMDPKNKELSGKYTSPVDRKDGTFLDREGGPWRIRLKGPGR